MAVGAVALPNRLGIVVCEVVGNGGTGACTACAAQLHAEMPADLSHGPIRWLCTKYIHEYHARLSHCPGLVANIHPSIDCHSQLLTVTTPVHFLLHTRALTQWAKWVWLRGLLYFPPAYHLPR